MKLRQNNEMIRQSWQHQDTLIMVKCRAHQAMCVDDGAVAMTSRSDDRIVPSTSGLQDTPTAPQEVAVVPVGAIGTPQFSTPSSMRPRDENYVTPHMAKLHVPEQRSQRKPTFIRQILPKGLSGDEAIRIREERLAEKKRLDEEKEKRKVDREEKKKKRIEDNERKRVMREQKKAECEAKKKRIEIEWANRKGGRRKTSRHDPTPPSSPSGSEHEVDDESDDDADVICIDRCYKCTKRFEDDTNGPMMEPVGCDRCPRWFHFGCIPTIIQDQVDEEIAISDVFFECDFCWTKMKKRWRRRWRRKKSYQFLTFIWSRLAFNDIYTGTYTWIYTGFLQLFINIIILYILYNLHFILYFCITMINDQF